MKQTNKNPIPRFRTALALSLLLGACSAGYSQDDLAEDDEIFELSPFEVTNSENDIGYYSERTLAGSRLNTKVSDLAASITVVTMQQMQDTASTDINDVFLYESSTEGFNNFTATGGSLADRGTVKDAGSGYSFANTGESSSSASSNRIRGLSGPTTTQNFYPTISGIPFDAYNTRTVEINRGPNSILSGLGSPAGIVNQSTTGAILNNNSSEVSIRFDDRGSIRGSFNHNHTIIEDKLSIFVAGLSEDKEFERKPSYDNTDRFTLALKYKPFEKTTFTASYENYKNKNRAPNSLTPRDFVTPWLEAGRPAYNPVTRMVTVLDTGAVSGPYDINSKSPTYQAGDQTGYNAFASSSSRHYVPGIATATGAASGRPVIMVGQEGYIAADMGTWYGWNANSNYPQSQSAPGNSATADEWEIQSRTWTSSTFNDYDSNVSNFVAPPVSDKSIYDWTEYNTLAMNYGSKDANTANIEFEQEVVDNLYLRVGWFRQEYNDIQNYTVQQQTGATLFIDTNTHLITGEVNPNFGLPYLEDYLPDTWLNENTNDNLRAQIAYELDLTEKDGWLKWAGKHNFLGLWSKQETKNLRLRLRGTGVGGDGRFLPWNDLTTTGNWRYYGNSSRIKRSYYLASPGDDYATVTAGAPTHWGQPNYIGVDGVIQDFGGPSSGMVKIYDWATNSPTEVPIEWGTALHDATSGRNERTLESQTLGWQGYFLDNRVITTVGLRKDDVDLRNTVGSTRLGRAEFTDKGWVMPDASYNRWSYIDANGDVQKNEDTISGAETKSYGVVAVPFKWEGGDFRVHYNKSDNFNPPTSAQTDIFGTRLENPTGVGEDWGFSVSGLDNKLVAKFNWFTNSAENERTGAARTLLSRLVTIDQKHLKSWAEQIAHMELGYQDYTIDEVNRPDLTTAQQETLEARVEEITGLPYSFPDGINYGATQSSVAEGMEVQLIYNPTKNWTMKMTAAQNETTSNNVAPEYDAWSAARVDFWKSLKSPLTAASDPNNDGDNNPNTYMFNGVREADLTNFFTAYGYSSEFDLANDARLWDNSSEYYNEAVLTQVALAKAQEGVPSPNLREWRANFVTNYQFTDGKFKGLGVGGSFRWESKSAIGYYGYAADPENPTVLNAPDPNRPFYDDGNVNIDLWASYSMALNDNIDWKVQLNIRNVQDSGELRPIAVDYAGNISGYRIIDPRQIFLTNTFSF